MTDYTAWILNPGRVTGHIDPGTCARKRYSMTRTRANNRAYSRAKGILGIEVGILGLRVF